MVNCKISIPTKKEKSLDISEDDFQTLKNAIDMGCSVAIIDNTNTRYARIKGYSKGKVAVEVNDDWGDISKIYYRLKEDEIHITDMDKLKEKVPRIINGYGVSTDEVIDFKDDYFDFRKNIRQLNERTEKLKDNAWEEIKK